MTLFFPCNGQGRKEARSSSSAQTLISPLVVPQPHADLMWPTATTTTNTARAVSSHCCGPSSSSSSRRSPSLPTHLVFFSMNLQISNKERHCCCSHINSHNPVRGHRTGSSHSGAEEYPREALGKPVSVRTAAINANAGVFFLCCDKSYADSLSRAMILLVCTDRLFFVFFCVFLFLSECRG